MALRLCAYMPNIKSAEKELRKGSKRRVYNVDIMKNLKELIKKSRKAIEAKDATAASLVGQAIKAFDKAAQKGVIKKNTASRGKSRLQIRLNVSKTKEAGAVKAKPAKAKSAKAAKASVAKSKAAKTKK